MAKATPISANKAGFTNEVGYKLLLQAAIISLMQDINKQARTVANDTPAESVVTITDANGNDYGTISRNKTSVSARVESVEAVADEHPEAMKLDIDPAKVDELIEYLTTNGVADKFLTKVPNDEVFTELSKQALERYTADGTVTPGWSFAEKRGNLVMKPGDRAHADALEYARSIGMVPQED